METLGTGSAQLKIKFQIGSYRQITFDFGTDVSTWTFELFLKRFKGDRLKTLSLTLGSGLAFPVYQSREITATFSTTNTKIEEGEYYIELRRLDLGIPLISGLAYFSFDAPDGDDLSNPFEFTIGTQAISLTITNGGSSASAFTLTTTGTSGPATYTGGVLNIPQYSGMPDPLVLTPYASQIYAAGKLWYDTANESLTFYNNDSNIGLQIGQEEWIRVKNVTGSTILNGSAIYINGANSGLPTIALAQSNAAATTVGMGLTTEDIANNAIGYVTTIGVVHGLNTLAFTAGLAVYIDPTTPGGLTQTAPSAPNFRYRVGIVAVSSATVGSIHVTPSTASLGNGTANQVFGMNNIASGQEVKSIVGTTNRLTITHTANTITLDVSSTLTGTFWSLATGGTLTGVNTITGTTTNTLKYIFNTLGSTITNGAGQWLSNTTAAINGTQQISPSTVYEGQGFGTGANTSQSVKFAISVTPVQAATNPGGLFNISMSVNNVAYSNIFTISTTGNMTNVTSISNVGTITFGTSTVATLSAVGSDAYITANNYMALRANNGATGFGITITPLNNVDIGNTTTDAARLYVLQAALAASHIPVTRFDAPTHTAIGTTTELNAYDFRGANWTWAAGTTATQRFAYFRSFTVTTGLVTNGYGLYVEAPTGNITNPWGLGVSGNTRLLGKCTADSDYILTDATKGLVLKDTQGTPHYWRVTISNVGAIVTADLGTTQP